MNDNNFCIWCGHKLGYDDQFCTNCGKKIPNNVVENNNNSYKDYKLQLEELIAKFENREAKAKELIEKRFEPPQMTYYTFINKLDDCRELFFKNVEIMNDIIDISEIPSEKIKEKLNNILSKLAKIIDELSKLIEELIISPTREQKDDEQLDHLFEDMDGLIDSVKKYS